MESDEAEQLHRQNAAGDGQKAEQERQKADLKKRMGQATQRYDQAQAKQSPTTLSEYLRHVQEKLVPILSVRSDLTDSASEHANMQGKYYPLKIRHLKHFPKTHNRIFGQFVQTISDKRLFPSQLEVRGVERDLPPTRKNEQDFWLYVRSAIEKSAQRVVRA
ncbi:hypothetical protein SI65_08235 [Aspergillus cristatus]|uniref:Uncharacterized protein n=1 Tax=Aspergillus cristatus TaxID=573508 RepID=A0A1E3B750_ASPCR|nr:hypothetical protein SI65_08235 [Aspergillus cristatus]